MNDIKRQSGPTESWESGESYQHYIGRWSRLIAAEFIGWLNAPPQQCWLDVGCGTGALSRTILELASPATVQGIDPSQSHITFARGTIHDERVAFLVGTAESLKLPSDSLDVAVSGLVLNFVPDPALGVVEMKRVIRKGGIIGAYVWDYADKMELMRYFWDAAGALDEAAILLDEVRRFPLCKAEPLQELFTAAGLQNVEVCPIDVATRFDNFDDYWLPFLGGQGPAPGYAMSLGEEGRALLLGRIRAALPVADDGSINLIARAWRYKEENLEHLDVEWCTILRLLIQRADVVGGPYMSNRLAGDYLRHLSIDFGRVTKVGKMRNNLINEESLNHVLNRMVDNKRIYGAALCVENDDGSFSWTGGAGTMRKDSRFFIASVTKLYVTAVTMRLVEENRIALDDKISKYLPAEMCEGIHVLKGVDYSDQITVSHLISNTSGLPDYFFHKQTDGRTVASSLMEGNDESWHLDRTIGVIKRLRPKFKPGAKGKASYSDTNYQLLGRIIETVTGRRIGAVFADYIFSELKLQDTYAYSDTSDNTPVAFYCKSKQLWLPQYIASVTAEGGIVSTANELMIFLKEFLNGRFFPKERINDLKQWNIMLPPPGLFYFGIGLEKLWTPWILSPFKPIKEIIGFWGQTGSFAFHNTETDLYFTGTTNQINGEGHRAAGNAMLRIIKSVL